MNQLREARKKIEKDHPDLIESVRKSMEKAGDSVFDRRNVEAMSVRKESGGGGDIPKTSRDEQGAEKIDRTKNLETILKFMNMKPLSPTMKRSLEDLLRR